MIQPPAPCELLRRLTVGTFVAMAVGGCLRSDALSQSTLGLADLYGSESCAANDIARPLIIEWPATERASLEGRLRRGAVVVRYDNCQVEVLSGCSAPGQYDYAGITRKHDIAAIKQRDDLYASFPLSAVRLEAELQNAGELSVAMTIVGNYTYVNDNSIIEHKALYGQCDGATHVIAEVQAGAFEFFTGSARVINGRVEVFHVGGVGGSQTQERKILAQDGDAEQCKEAQPEDRSPPHNCGALMKLEIVPIGREMGNANTCTNGTEWNGMTCICPETTAWDGTHCVEIDVLLGDRYAATAYCKLTAHCMEEDGWETIPQATIDACIEIEMQYKQLRPGVRECLRIGQQRGCDAMDKCKGL